MGLTIESRHEFVSHAVRLGLWFAAVRYSSGGGEKKFRQILTSETPVYRLTELWDGKNHPANPPAGWRNECWENIVTELESIFMASSAQFEETGYKLLEPLLFARVEKDVAAWPWLPCGYCTYKLPESNIFGAFAFEPVDQHPVCGKMIAIHIANNRIPHSPLEDIPGLKRELSALADYVAEKYPEHKKIGCNSWLNSLSRFKIIFPDEWTNPESPTGRIGYGYNWWGQFVSRTGGFNFHNAALMREKRTFPFQAVDGFCTVDRLRKHLNCLL